MQSIWASPGAVGHLVDEHLARYPLMQPSDAYKLLYQGVRGPEHLVTSPEAFATRLRTEYRAVTPAAEEWLWEVVRPDGALGRLNLRPFSARAGDLDALIHACLETAARSWGTHAELQAVWLAFVGEWRRGRWATAFARDDVLVLARRLEEEGYPPVHHSPVYREAYQPAYRLVRRGDLTVLAGL
jgi:hypothetical protein